MPPPTLNSEEPDYHFNTLRIIQIVIYTRCHLCESM